MSLQRFGIRGLLPLLLIGGVCSCAGSSGGASAPREVATYPGTRGELTRVITGEMEAQGLPAVSIAIADRDGIVWSEAFGQADPAAKTPATRQTLFRVGSISKLITALAVMQLVEAGRLDLDAPLEAALPGWSTHNASGRPVTLRQILSHRSGLVREPPIGSYFDAGEPGLDATAKSLYGLAAIYEPGERLKYSNAAVTLAGYAVERVSGMDYASYVQERVLFPCGMRDSAFHESPGVARRLARGFMWGRDGRWSEAPTFELGTVPAGQLYASMDDLARLAQVLLRGGLGPAGRVARPETLARMWEPQIAPDNGFGIGFALSSLDGHRAVGHGGAIYGFASQLTILPDDGLAVAVSINVDVANAVARRIADHALRCLLRERAGEPLPSLPLSELVERAAARRVEGRYATDEETVELEERDGHLVLRRGPLLAEVRRDPEGLIVDDRHTYGPRIAVTQDGLRIGDRDFRLAKDGRPPPPAARFEEFIGEYGPDHNVLYVLERGGELHALVEWFFEYPLKEVAQDVFAFPASGLYDGETLVFERAADGTVSGALMAGVRFPRRTTGAADGVFRIDPLRPVSELREAALEARPPREEGKLAPDLVELKSLDPTILYDIRYATTRNFLGAPFYTSAHAFMQRPAAEALVRAHRSLKPQGLGILVFDSYRPWYVTKMFYDATPDPMKDFVADPAQGSRHNRGCAADITLYDLATGEPVSMVSGYDEFTSRAWPWYPGGTSRQRWHRMLLRRAMEDHGFDVYVYEWWHFDHETWKRYPILNRRFEELLP